MDEAAPRSARTDLVRSFLLLVVGLALYLVSVGPAAALHSRGKFGSATPVVEAVYYPVSRLYASIPVVQPLFDAWIKFWEKLL